MSNLWNWAAKDVFSLGQKRDTATMNPQAHRLGKNRDPYYGLAAQSILDEKHGKKKYADSVLGPGNGIKKAMSASGQLLGGGG
jgi:hypothetical protein